MNTAHSDVDWEAALLELYRFHREARLGLVAPRRRSQILTAYLRDWLARQYGVRLPSREQMQRRVTALMAALGDLEGAQNAQSMPDGSRSSLSGFDQLPDSANVRLPVVQALFACSDETVRRRVKAGLLPKPRKLGPRVTAWNVGELRRVLNG